MHQFEELIPPYTAPLRSILLFGPPGSGKGTLGKLLASGGNHVHLSSGDIFRGLSPDSPAGKIYHNYASRGHLVPDDTTLAIWRHYVDGLIATNRYFPQTQLLLLDGIPRTLAQAEMLDRSIKVLQVIVLEAPHIDTLIARMKRRALIEGRSDDTHEEVLKTRMQVYERDTAKLLKHYPDSLISRFNADQRPLEVLKDVLASLSHLLSH